MDKYYIYKATNLINGKSYIGETKQLRERIWQHLRRYEKEDCLFHQELEKYGEDKFSWEVIAETDSKSKAVELEKTYIKQYNTLKPFGYNMNKGGVGGHNAKAVVCLEFDGTFVKRYDSAMDAQKEDGYCNSDVLLSCKNINARCKDKIFMFESEYLANGSKTYVKKELGHKKTVIQCDAEGNMIKRFDSVSQAGAEFNVDPSRISGVASGKTKSVKGFIFVYEEDFPIKDMSKYLKRKKGRKVFQVDPETNEVIDSFERISDAGKKLGVNYKPIQKVIDLEKRTAYGYKWISQYVDTVLIN